MLAEEGAEKEAGELRAPPGAGAEAGAKPAACCLAPAQAALRAAASASFLDLSAASFF